MSELVFPTNWANDNELEFLDGTRVVPEYLATLMGGLDTTQLTYEQAVNAVNSGFIGDSLSKAQNTAIKEHFERGRNGTR